MTSPSRVAELVREYEIKARDREGIYLSDSSAANVLFDRMHAIAKELRETAEGRAAFQTLMSYPMEGVRLNVATECLAWSSAPALEVLQDIERGRGLNATAAKHVVRQYHDGTLNLDW